MDSSQEPPGSLDLAKHGRALRALAQSVLRDEHAADDAVQDALLHVVRAGTAGDPSLFQRLRGLVLRHARDHRRSDSARRVREQRHARERFESHPDVERSFQSAETVTRALAAMPRASRDILWLRFYEDLGASQIATRLGLPLETVRARLRRALASLRSDVEARLQAEGRTLHALLPLAGLASVGGSPAITVAGATGGLLLMKKLILATLAIVAGIVWVERSRDAVEISSLKFEAVDPLKLAPVSTESGVEGEPRAASVLQPVANETQRSNASTLVPEKEVEAAIPPELIQLRVTVRDQAVAQIVPFYSFEAVFGGAAQELRTDRYGIVELEVPAGEPVELVWGKGIELRHMGTLQRGFIDSYIPSETGSRKGVHYVTTLSSFLQVWESSISGEIDLTVAAGPTWFLELSMASDEPLPLLSELQAELIYSKVGLPPAPVQELMQDSDVVWVRFPELEAWKNFDTSVLDLLIYRKDEMAEGFTTVTRRAGFDPAPLRISMERRCAIQGIVIDEAGEEVYDVAIGAQVPGGEKVFRSTTDLDGSYKILGLEPGLWTLYVSSPRFEPFQQSITLRPGEIENGDLTLRRKLGGGTISGEITSRTGEFDGWVFLFLEGTAETPFWRRSDPEFEDSSAGKVARFEFDYVPPGEYRLICNTDQPFKIVDRVRIIEPPMGDLHFVLLDDVVPRPLVVKASAADTGDSLDHTLRMIVDGGYADTKQGTVESPASIDVPSGSTFTWTVSSTGFQPIIGNQSDLEGDEIRAAMEPGFGAWFHFVDVESLNDLSGVELFADGVSIGRTNSRGDLFASWPERPERVHFDENEWLIHHSLTYQSDIDPNSGALLSKEGDPSIYAYLRRAR